MPDITDFRSEAWRGRPGGYRIGQTRDGVWWWVTPTDQPQYLCGVEGVRRTAAHASGQALLGQLTGWGFNLLGSASASEFAGHGIPHLVSLELRSADVAVIRTGGAHLPDVFDAGWPATCAARVAAVNAHRGLAGYLSDQDLAWAQPAAAGGGPSRPTLLQLCLGLDPGHAAYHAAWEFVLAPWAGDLGALGRAWGVPLRNKETVRQMTRDEEALTTPGYLADQTRFTREFAQRYFRLAAAAVRQADPGRLFFGAPVPANLPAEIREAAAAHSDVVLTDAPPAGPGGGPMIVAGFDWSGMAGEADAGRPPRLSRLERMHREGRAALEALARHPNVIGYFWRAYVHGDRIAQAPFASGLVYEDGTVAHEHTQLLAAINRHAAAVRAAAANEECRMENAE